MKPFPSLLRLFDHSDEDIVSDAMCSVDCIMYYGAIGSESNSVHPYYEELASAGGIEKIYDLFRKTQDEYTKDISATCLGIAFKAQEITNPEMKDEIIAHLASIINHEDEDIQKQAILALNYLDQNLSIKLQKQRKQQMQFNPYLISAQLSSPDPLAVLIANINTPANLAATRQDQTYASPLL
ncbi:MAG: hypothetical protein EZS28_012916 [Streblomastix strix]|uniref:Uncharacterized protein n=1 Tax=Streblomastix strix TaxID=222440 RepID=A0A5J4WB06_9EUKA|nr:MAG: hypothetical protein EZS28_012916 [Streblomastix strix]